MWTKWELWALGLSQYGAGPTRGWRRQLSLENSKINQINEDFGYSYIKNWDQH